MVAQVLFPPTRAITQGTIFVGGVAEDYENCRTCGIVITARCDAVNEKTRTYNYLPVVHFDDWLQRDGVLILVDRVCADLRNGMRSILKAQSLSPSILETEEPSRVAEILLSGEDRKMITAKQRFQDLCKRWVAVCELNGKSPDEHPYVELSKNDQKTSDQLIRELIQHKLAGYYFLSKIEPDGENLGFVVMLREVRSLPKEIVNALRSGISRSDFEEMCRLEPCHRGRLNIQNEDLAMPISMLTSPHTEHLMQIFSSLFGRIGVPDTPLEYLQTLCSRQPSFVGASE